MRTNIDIDDNLMAEAQKASGHATKKQSVEEALRLMIRLRRRGVTVRKTIDLLIVTWCIENCRSLLHHDSDFRPMRRLGLVEVPITA